MLLCGECVCMWRVWARACACGGACVGAFVWMRVW